MKDVFGAVHSGAYDLIYSDKDYPAECDLIESLFKQYSEIPVRKVLDLCCGTGNHSIPLARRGYEMTGVDRSEFMLESARNKSGDLPTLQLVPGDVRQLDLKISYDAVLMMFAALGYQTLDMDLHGTLAIVQRHLRPGGLFLFDVWYAPAVLHLRPVERTRTFPLHDGEIVRKSHAVLNPDRKTCTVHIDISENRKGRVPRKVAEEHPMRFFYREEIERLLSENEMSLLQLTAFPEHQREPDENTWNVLGVARRNGR